MLGRSFRVFLLVFEALFLNVVIPGHTRGMITLSGKESVHGIADLGCPFCCDSGTRPRKDAPTRQDRQDCAICHLALCLTTVPPADLRLGELGLLPLLVLPVRPMPPVTADASIHYCRGPPVLCS